ncbi:MAG: hypothetical protein AAF253_01935 [Pseudomonadota bacterium]
MNRIKTFAAAFAGAAMAASAAFAQEEEPAEAAPSILDGPFAQVQGVWAISDEACGDAPWQIAGNEFTTGYVGAVCSFDPATLATSENRSRTVTSFSAPATCAFGEETSDWNYAFMLSSSGQTLWVSASNALERTLSRCGLPGEEDGGDEFPG